MSRNGNTRDDVTPECNCCGKEFPRLTTSKIEGAAIEVCERCSKFGSKVDVLQPVNYTPIKRSIKLSELSNPDLILIPEYGKLIAKVRESKGLTRYDFAKRISEKESVIKRLEDEKFEADEELINKIEDFLDIRLREKYEEAVLRQRGKKRPSLTVGDVVEVG